MKRIEIDKMPPHWLGHEVISAKIPSYRSIWWAHFDGITGREGGYMFRDMGRMHFVMKKKFFWQ